MKNIIYLGIDQTGAKDSKGKPKPLPACLLQAQSLSFVYLDSLTTTELSKHVESSKLDKLLTCVDCVLGLPTDLKISWRQALSQLAYFEGYGRKPAQDYFRSISNNLIYRRRIELACKANSVFQEKPYQKNIQTGTFRIWKDLSSNPKDFYVPALEEKYFLYQLPLFEGYPSYSWKLLLGSKHRRPEALPELIKAHQIKVNWTKAHQDSVMKDPNLADAFLLALTMRHFKEDALKQRPHPEGWILGAPSRP